MNNKIKIFNFCIFVIAVLLFVNKVLVPQNINSGNDEIADEATQEEEIGLSENTFMVDKHMFLEEGNGVFATSAVCVHNGKPYVLTEEEYVYLIDGGQMQEVLKQRKELNQGIDYQQESDFLMYMVP